MLAVTPISLRSVPVLATEESVSEFQNLLLRSPCLPGEGEGNRVGEKGEEVLSGRVQVDSHAPVCPELCRPPSPPLQCLPLSCFLFLPLHLSPFGSLFLSLGHRLCGSAHPPPPLVQLLALCP